MRLEVPLAALLFPLAALPARALDVGKAPPEAFIARSRAEPERLHALIIGATWCRACKLLAANLAAHDASSATAVGRAAWDEVESDEYGTAKLSRLLETLRAPESASLPTVLVLRDGQALGMSLAGNNVPSIEAFLAEAERQPARSARKPANASMLCPGRRDWASYTLGISGYRGEHDSSTDDFGRKVLLSFAGPKASGRARLFAPPRSAAPSAGTESARAADGVFFTATDPVAERSSLLADVARSTAALAALASAPGSELRLVLTGHSGENGMTIGYHAARWSEDDPADTYQQGSTLSPADVAAAVRRASRAGKTVRGLVTTCYAGRYADAFMPRPGAVSAPACAAFATLPDKLADGCYANGTTLGVDYASKLLAGRECRAPQDGRALHYAVAASTTGRDVPLLTSEYFLLYGPGAEYLGRGKRAPAPPRAVQRYALPGGVQVYVDVISNQVLRAFQAGRRIPAPRLALLDCVTDDDTFAKLDRENPSSFYLRPHKTGARVAECTPYVSLYWEPGDGAVRASTSVHLDADYSGWNPGDDYEGFRKDFGDEGPTITLEGMRPAARVLLASVIPAFSDAGAAADLGGRLDRIADEVQAYDEPLSAALRLLMAEQPGGLKRAPPPTSAPRKSTGTADELTETLARISKSLELGVHSPSPPVDASELVAAMLDALSPSSEDYPGPAVKRLAHVAAAAQAELSLHEEAKTSPEARRLLAQLETIKTCEQGLY